MFESFTRILQVLYSKANLMKKRSLLVVNKHFEEDLTQQYDFVVFV